MPRHIKIGLVILGLGFIVTLGDFLNIVGRIRSVVEVDETDHNPFKTPSEPLYSPADPLLSVKIFFPSKSGEMLLAAEDRTIFASAQTVNRAKQILGELLKGPVSDQMYLAVPEETELQEVFVSERGLAFVDFTITISTNHPGGILEEHATIYAVVNSLTYNLREIQGVKILVGGVEKDTLAGHCLLLLPFAMDLSITDIPQPEPRTVVSLETR